MHTMEGMPPGMHHVVQAAARILLHDWNDGRIPFFTMPPQRDTHGHAAAAVIPSWSQDFNVDEVGTPARALLGYTFLIYKQTALWDCRRGEAVACKVVTCCWMSVAWTSM